MLTTPKLTPKQNLLETIRGGNPERYVNQYEFIELFFTPPLMHGGGAQKGQENVKNAWGVTNSWPEHVPGSFPVHTPETIVVKDIEHWRDYVHAPKLDFPDEEWAMCKERMFDPIDGNMVFKAPFIAPGIFEQTHHLCEISNALIYYMTNPDEMHDLIAYILDYELEMAEKICSKLHPDAMFHHDDWGSEKSTFMSPAMFEDFFVEPYKQLYGYYHDHGVELVIHHADSWCESIVPDMIEIGIDIWQGCMESNNLPMLIEKYGGKISFMGGIDNKSVDFVGWTQEDCRKAARRAMDRCGSKYFIPCITQGGPGSVFPGTYMALVEEIDKYSEEKFGIDASKIQRLPINIMF
jgi:hypothetical protein